MKPLQVATYVKSATHRRFGHSAFCRLTRAAAILSRASCRQTLRTP